MKKAVMMYSMGKDSSAAFVKAAKDGYKIERIITMFDEERNNSQVHMAKKKLVEFIAKQMGVELDFIGKAPKGDFNAHWKMIYKDYNDMGYEYMIHGDIFLEDVKKFKDDHAEGSGVENIYPLFGMDAHECAQLIIDLGVDSYITVTNKEDLKPFLGKKYSEMLPHIPEKYCPCGENGEFHTIVCNAPFLDGEIEYTFSELSQLTNEFEEKTFKYWYLIANEFKLKNDK